KASDYAANTYGQENEYTAKGLIAGVEAIMIDISAVIRKPTHLIKMTTAAERNELVTILTTLHTYVTQGSLPNIATQVDKIKPIIRGLNVRYSHERLDEFNEYIDDLQKRSLAMTSLIEALKEAKLKSDETSAEIQTVF